MKPGLRAVSLLVPNTRNKFFVAAALAALGATAFLVFGNKPTTDLIQIQFAGLTNHYGGSHVVMRYVLTNVSGVAVQVSGVQEVKTGAGWPVYGPDMHPTVTRMEDLPPRQSTVWTVAVPDYGYAWRVQFTYMEAPTKCDKIRFKCATFLRQRKLPQLARFVSPRKRGGEIMMPEMDSRPPSWLGRTAQ
jgi:hypothetical protein